VSDKHGPLASLPADIQAWIPPGCPHKDTKQPVSDLERTFEALWSMKGDVDGRPATDHRYGGVPLFSKKSERTFVQMFPDRNLDCPQCGPIKRRRKTTLAVSALQGRELFVTLDPRLKPPDAARKYVARHHAQSADARSVSIPVSQGRLIVSTLPLPQKGSLSSIECGPDCVKDVVEWAIGLWWRDGRRVSSTPRSILTDNEFSSGNGQYEAGEPFGQLHKFIGLLDGLDIPYSMTNGRLDIHSSSPFTLVDLVSLHADRSSDAFEPCPSALIEKGLG